MKRFFWALLELDFYQVQREPFLLVGSRGGGSTITQQLAKLQFTKEERCKHYTASTISIDLLRRETRRIHSSV